jgi:hypothetical protein
MLLFYAVVFLRDRPSALGTSMAKRMAASIRPTAEQVKTPGYPQRLITQEPNAAPIARASSITI